MVIWILWTNCPSIQVIAAFLLTSAQKRCRLERPICTVSTANSRQLHPFHLVAIIWTSKLTQSSFTFFKLRVRAIFKWKFQTALLLVLLLLLLLLLGAARMATLLRNDGAPARPLSVCLTVSLSLSAAVSLALTQTSMSSAAAQQTLSAVFLLTVNCVNYLFRVASSHTERRPLIQLVPAHVQFSRDRLPPLIL